MDIPGLTDLPAKLLSQCGIVTAVLLAGIVWLAVKLASAQKQSETDRASFMKLYNDQTSAYEKLAIASAKTETLLFALQSRGAGRNDD